MAKLRSLLLVTAALAIPAVAVLLSRPGGESPPPRPGTSDVPARPELLELSADVPPPPQWLVTREVRADVRERRGHYDVSPEFREAVRGFDAAFKPTTARPVPKGLGLPLDVDRGVAADGLAPPPLVPAPLAPAGSGQVASFESTDFVDALNNTGAVFIPADPQGAAGPNHVASVVNTSLAIHTKTGTEVASLSLANFFDGLNPVTFTFDPRVIYDEHNGRWLLITTEFTDTVVGFPSNTSRIFLAVSDDDDPIGAWTIAAIDAVTTFSTPGAGTVPHWVDFPQISVDEEAIYISGNMFTFFNTGGLFGGIRLWIIDKGEGSGGLYDGGVATIDQYNPLPSPAIVTGSTPATVFGTPAAATLGTFLVSYSGISDGVQEAVQVVRISNPLGAPTFSPSLVIVGNIHNTAVALPAAPQSGSTVRIVTNDARALHAVWRQDNLWATFSITPNAGDPEVGQAVAHWVRIGVAAAPALIEQGRVSGEDIAPGTHTFYPSLSVNADLDVMIGFSASAASIFPGAYYALHDAGAAPGTVGPSMTLRAGLEFYVRRLGGTLNRWGDFSSVFTDPVDGCFWIFNKYAMLRGTPTDSGNGPEDGRWGTRFAKFCNAACAGTPDPVNIVLDDTAGTVVSWPDQGPGFSYDVVIGSVSVMRSQGMVGPAGCLVAATSTPEVLDTLANPPPGEARYYLVRGRSICELGDYGTDSDGVPRVPAPGCPD